MKERRIRTFLKSGMKFELIKCEVNVSLPYEIIFDAFISTTIV